MPTHIRQPLLSYGVVVASVAAALLIGWFTPLNQFSPTALFFVAVMVSSWCGGLGPGLAATALSALVIDLFLVATPFSLNLDLGDATRLGVFILEALVISGLNGSRIRLEESLRRQNRELVAAHRHKDQFFATLGHELRNPLSPISNGLQILRRRSEGDPVTAEVCDVADRQIRHMTRLVDDLLDVSRVALGKVRLKKEPVELAAIVDDAVETCSTAISARHHKLTVALPDHPVWLEADPVRLRQVLVNLLNNAAKYTEPDGDIRVTAAREGEGVAVRVQDTGVGIGPELLPNVFDVFTQSERSLDRSDGGLGIGLSLVRGLVELHDGRVEARSEGPGRGSEFIVWLPALRQRPPQERGLYDRDEPAPQSLRVLIVDDNVDAAQMLAMLLSLSGYETSEAFDGSSAIDRVSSERPDVVLLDIGLPDMNGYEVARRLRELPGTDDLLLIALTGYGQEDDRRRSQQAGFDHHLLKPVHVQELNGLLSQWTGHRAPSSGS